MAKNALELACEEMNLSEVQMHEVQDYMEKNNYGLMRSKDFQKIMALTGRDTEVDISIPYVLRSLDTLKERLDKEIKAKGKDNFESLQAKN